MARETYFAAPTTWQAACDMLVFQPLVPRYLAGFRLQLLSVHVRDRKQRELAIGDRTFEAAYGGFVFSQAHTGDREARRRALEMSYGWDARAGYVGAHDAKIYELGAEPEPGDIDGRSPAVVTWHDGPLFCLLASDRLPATMLLRVAASVYDAGPRRGHIISKSRARR